MEEAEIYEKWYPVPNVPEFLTACVTQDYDLNLIVRLHQGYRDLELKELIGPDLVIEFGKVPGFMVHEEFSHPWNDNPIPLPQHERISRAHSCLIVRNSRWLASFSENRLVGRENCTHYQISTAFPIIDVLSNRLPKTYWQKPI